MVIDKNNISMVHEVSAVDFIYLREKVNFQRLEKSQAERILEHTAYISAVCYEEKIIGLTRLLFDYGTDAYITDVIVLTEYQGCGIGKMLIEDVLNYIRENSFAGTKVACSIYANKGKERFYEKFGFSKLPNEKYGYGMLMEI